MIPENGKPFRMRSRFNKELECDADSARNHRALAYEGGGLKLPASPNAPSINGSLASARDGSSGTALADASFLLQTHSSFILKRDPETREPVFSNRASLPMGLRPLTTGETARSRRSLGKGSGRRMLAFSPANIVNHKPQLSGNPMIQHAEKRSRMRFRRARRCHPPAP
jgi:hypothetical protein